MLKIAVANKDPHEHELNFGIADVLVPCLSHRLVTTMTPIFNYNTIFQTPTDVTIVSRTVDAEEIAKYDPTTPTALVSLVHYRNGARKT